MNINKFEIKPLFKIKQLKINKKVILLCNLLVNND